MTVSEDRITYIAQHVATWTFQHLIAVTDVDRITALECAKDAADSFAANLDRSLREHQVVIEREI